MEALPPFHCSHQAHYPSLVQLIDSSALMMMFSLQQDMLLLLLTLGTGQMARGRASANGAAEQPPATPPQPTALWGAQVPPPLQHGALLGMTGPCLPPPPLLYLGGGGPSVPATRPSGCTCQGRCRTKTTVMGTAGSICPPSRSTQLPVPQACAELLGCALLQRGKR